MKPLDIIDHKILNILQEDASVSIKDVAERVGLSFTPTYERIKTLKTNGVIKKQLVILDYEKAANLEVIAYCSVTLKEQSSPAVQAFEEGARKEARILEMYSLTGEYDYMLKILSKNLRHYNEFITKLAIKYPIIAHYQSQFVLSTIKADTKYAFSEE